jgi:hypothetical protein
MRPIFAIALMFMCFSAPAYAAMSDDEYEKYIRGLIVAKVALINKTVEFQENACSKLVPASKAACDAAYDELIQRRFAEKARLEFWIAALKLKPSERVRIDAEFTAPKYDAMTRETDNLAKVVVEVFPQVKKSASK